MLTDYILDFSTGSLLTGQLLKKMYEHPKELIRCIFSDYSEGVISGLNVKYDGQKLTLSKGIYKHNSSLYILENETIIAENCHFEGAEWYAIIAEEKKEEKDNITVKRLNIQVKNSNEEERKKLTKDNLILFSFKHRPSFDDFEAGAYSLLDYKHSCLGKESTFMPQFFKLAYKKLSSKDKNHPFDYVIMSEILSRGIVSCELMRAYIKCRLNRKISDSDREFLDSRKELMTAFLEAISKESYDNNEFNKPTQRNTENESCLL